MRVRVDLLDRNGREVTAGLGIGVRPRPEVEAAVASGALEHVLPDYVFDRIVLHALLPPGRIRLPRVAAMIDLLRTSLGLRSRIP